MVFAATDEPTDRTGIHQLAHIQVDDGYKYNILLRETLAAAVISYTGLFFVACADGLSSD